ncbi:leucine-rich repeat-containing protein 4B-like [Liolophura sinensis]|uniref:leucine-rich repeat-containing protein 4B-like n=1 Tax=Liolophura sinensis TaxID=3198878 RepID=UPI003158B3DA
MMMKFLVTSLGEALLAAVILWLLPGSKCAPFCGENLKCGCNVTDSCTICPRGLVPSGHGILGPRQFSPDEKCLKISKGSSEELSLLIHFEGLIHLEIHRYFIPAVSQKNLPFYRNTNLSYLSLSNNGIQTFVEDFFSELSALRHLDLSGNQIHKMPSQLFAQLHSLESVMLQENLIKNLPLELFSGQGKLKLLNLCDNKISFLHHEQFVNLSALESLDVSNNNLKAVPEEVVADFARLKNVNLHSNPWDCSCSVGPLVRLLHTSSAPSMQSPPLCRSPQKYRSKVLTELSMDAVNCSVPVIISVSESVDVIYNSKFSLTCQAEGFPKPAILWTLPVGDFFGHPSDYHLLDQSELVQVFSDNLYVFSDHLQRTHVTSPVHGQITVNGMRGALSGNYTCTAINPAGNDTVHVTVSVHTGLPVAYSGSLLFSAELTSAFIVCGFFIGLISYIVNRCRSQTEKKSVDETDENKGASEVMDVESEGTSTVRDFDDNLDGDEDDDSQVPGTSPLLSTGTSPGKCRTPTGEDYDKFAAEFPENIRETLDDVRWRLRHGVERNIERVRHQVMTIKSSGSQYIDTIRSSSSNAANRVRAGVVMGMEQVKCGVQSIKEFCGTGDMGAQTISTISVSTDVDTQESTETVKTITFV